MTLSGIGLSKAKRPTKHIIGHIEDGFLRVKWPNQQSQSTEGRSGPKDYASIPSGPPYRAHDNTTDMQYETKTHKIHTDKH